MLDLGEDYTITSLDGEEFTGKISLKSKTNSTYMMEEQEYAFTGVATFPDLESQTYLRGCYFRRQIDPNEIYILRSTIPEATNEKIAYISVLKCNETVSLANLEKQMDEKFDEVTTPVVFAKDVYVYFDTTLQKQRRSSDGNFEQTLYYMQMPAHFGLSEDQVVLRKTFKWNPETSKNEIVDARYRVESVTLSMTTIDEDGTVHGICDVQMSLDTRG